MKRGFFLLFILILQLGSLQVKAADLRGAESVYGREQTAESTNILEQTEKAGNLREHAETDADSRKATEEDLDFQKQTETDADIWGQAEEYLEIGEIEAALAEFDETESFSFSDTLQSLLRGELDFDLKKIGSYISKLFLGELKQLRSLIFRILIVVLASAVFSNFIQVFENSQIADISFYMMYLLISVMLVKAFSVMNQITVRSCESIADFMKVLMPSYLITVVMSSGSVTALGFYEITLLAMNLLQLLVIKIILPGINFYLILLILNQIAQEDYFSKLAQLAESVIGWMIKSILGIVLGLQAVQCLIAPAVDSLKNSAVHRLAKSIPGIGSALDAAAETVAGSAVIIKNAVGVTGMLALAVICLTPLVKLAAAILLFRLLCALIQPICEKRLVEGIESVSQGTTLLFRVLLASLSVFVISLAMITASAKGG